MTGPKIVIIDDEIDLGRLLKIELEAEGYNIYVALDGKEGLELTRAVSPQLVLLDIMMPVMDGYEVLGALKGDKETKDIPVILFTAKGQEVDIQKGLEMGAHDYVTKPFHTGLLVKRIDLTLKKKGSDALE